MYISNIRYRQKTRTIDGMYIGVSIGANIITNISNMGQLAIKAYFL